MPSFFSVKIPAGYVLENQVTHARFLPVKSAHTFNYPTLSLLVSLNALESHSLDLGGGWIFGYGGLWCRLTGLRPDPYLTGLNGSIRSKLNKVLSERGLIHSGDELEDAWMMTMPSLLGIEGINPLTVYFCYKPGGVFWLTVLEVHNTFSEAHVYILEAGLKEDEALEGFDHSWTFPRAFHVSPFNDRSGFYTVSVKSPTHAPTATIIDSDWPPAPPRPTVRVRLHTCLSSKDTGIGPLKLIALLRPTASTPLSTKSLLLALSRMPFALFLSFAHILYQAWILHYKKRLDVFIRPEPFPAALQWGEGTKGTLDPSTGPAGGVRWQVDGLLESYAHRRVEDFLRHRVERIGISVNLIAADPTVPRQTFAPAVTGVKKQILTISYLSSRFFTHLLLCPSAEHALLLGYKTEQLFFPSSTELFLSVFSSPTPSNSPASCSFRQHLRTVPIPAALTLPVPPKHFLDENRGFSAPLSTAIICALLFFDRLEAFLFRVLRARPVEGQEPWRQWERASKVHAGETSTVQRDSIGTVRRDA